MGTGTSLAVLVGNGLSIAVNDALQLDRLTQDFLDRHDADRADLDRLVAGIHLGDVDPARDFEGLVAGLESAEEVISAFMGLARGVAHPQMRAAADLLEEKGVPALARRLYYAYCAEVLDAIGELARGTLPTAAIAFGDWLKAMYQAHGSAGLFTLNYDVLLERMLVDENVLGLKPALTDFFSGLEERQRAFELVPEREPAVGRLFYPEDPADRPIELHHLHGCLTHFRLHEDGSIWKFDSSDIRSLGVYDYLMGAGAATFAPSVILGSRKIEKSRDWPFSFAFLSLEQEARAARTVVIAGYSFRDEAVNARLAATAASGERRWIVINRKGSLEVAEYMDRVSSLLRPAKIEFALGGFDGDLPDIVSPAPAPRTPSIGFFDIVDETQGSSWGPMSCQQVEANGFVFNGTY